MDPATISLIAGLLLKYGPGIASAIVNLFSKNTHTIEDWNGIFDSVRKYEEMDADSKKRVGSTTTTVTV